MNQQSSPISTAGGDWLRSFHIEDAGVRGVIVRLGEAWRTVAAHCHDGATVTRWLGECQTAAALFAGDIKLNGSVSVQLRAPRSLGTVFAECTDAGTVRGIARTLPDAQVPASVADLDHDAVLAITIEREGGQRYQGLVPLQGDTLSQAFEGYFDRSEQLPTALRLAATPTLCAGMLLQQIPSSGGHALRSATPDFERLGILFSTLTDDELLSLAPETILRRLFVEDDIRVHPERPLAFGCSCGRDRVARVLTSLGEAEAMASVTAEGTASVRCEFCGETYAFSRQQLEALFAGDMG